MVVNKNKKGIFFTAISISLIALILYSYSATYSYSLQETSAVIDTRVGTMNNFLKGLDADMQNAIYISGFRSLVAMTDYVVNNGVFFNSTQNSFQDLFLNGTIGGTNNTILENNTFTDWITKIKDEAENIGVNVTITSPVTSIAHFDPWTIRVFLNATVNLSDSDNIAFWFTNKSLYADISIIDFEDPWYAVYTSGNAIKNIVTTPYEGNYTQNNGNATDNLRIHIQETYYASFNRSPSFLMRFENNFNASPFGIESIVNKTQISAWKACPTETSSLDNIYWRCMSNMSVFQIPGFANFRMDNLTSINNSLTRLEKYMIDEVAS